MLANRTIDNGFHVGAWRASGLAGISPGINEHG
jgi:hypothetical protein